MSKSDSSNPRRFAIAFSFPGERREYVEQVANALLPAFGGERGKARIFYDNWHESLIIGYTSNRKLQNIYATASDLIVPFYCQDYHDKKWCGVELRVIEALLFDQEYERVLPFRFDRVEIPSSFKTDIFPVVSARPAEEVARLILDRYRELYPESIEPVPSREGGQSAAIRADISRIMKYAPSNLIGREAETTILFDAWDRVVRGETKCPHILTFVALGGEGKTSLVAKWAVDLAFQDWPGCDAAFAWSFYSQGTREQLAASSDLFLTEALTFFGDTAMAGSAAGAFEKGKRLARLVGERRALLILDGLEPLQYAPTSPTRGELKDQGIGALLKGLAAASHGLCVITTRYSIPDLRGFVGKTVEEKRLARLSTTAGVALLQCFEVKGSLRKNIPCPDGRTLCNEFEKLVEDVKGHALTLNLLGSYLRDAHAGDIRKRDLIRLTEADAEEQGGHAFHVMDAYVTALASGGKTEDDQAKGLRALAILRLLGLFDRPATADNLAALWDGDAIAGLTEPLIGISEAQRNLVLQRLEDAKLLTAIRAQASGVLVALDAHPLVREYFGQRLRDAQPDAWRAAHRRLYEHLCATTPDKPDATLEDLQPLYQAVAHGCHAGLQDEAFDRVYSTRLQRGKLHYPHKRLGAVGTDLACISAFFSNLWTDVTTEVGLDTAIEVLDSASESLHSMGRLVEARQAMNSLHSLTVLNNRRSKSINAAILLSEVSASLGQLNDALRFAQEAIANRPSSFQCKMGHVALGVAYQHRGEFRFAAAAFRNAERLEARRIDGHQCLRSLQGYWYSEHLIEIGARHADSADRRSLLADLESRAEICLASARAPLNHLALGLAQLTKAQARLALTRGDDSSIHYGAGMIDHTIAELRLAGDVRFVAAGLLTRAWLRSLTGPRTRPESAQSDLDEAWEIAERGPMPLVLADIHLYRARLFFREATYPWQSPQHDLAEARRLIFKHGYLRRKEELEDAEDALKHFAEAPTQ